MPSFSPIARQLIDQYKQYASQISAKKSSSVITVNEAISTAAFLYERMRTVIDYKEEHLLKKDAIKRILLRRFRSDGDAKKIARLMLRELIRSRYLPNSSVPSDEIYQTAQIISKYQALYRATRANKQWLLAVAACEIDDGLSLYTRENAMVEAMYAKIVDKIMLSKEVIDEDTRKIQVLVAIQRALVKADQDLIRYSLLQLYYPDWKSMTPERVMGLVSQIGQVIERIEFQLDHPIRNRLLNVVRKYAPPFLILRDLLEKNPERAEQILQHMPQQVSEEHGFNKSEKQTFDAYLEKVITKKYDDLKNRVRRRAFRAVIYLFLTKVILAIIFEIPYDILVLGEIHTSVLAINLFFHPLFVFVIAFLVRPPGKRNTVALIQGTKEVLFADTKQKIYTPTRITVAQRTLFAKIAFTIFYALLFFVTYGVILLGLRSLDFNLMSATIFVILFSTVSFFAVSLRYLMKEYVVAKVRENFFSFLFDVFTLPIIMAGRWISVNFSRVNVFVFVLDVIIEAPFQTIIVVFEKWVSFIREKREEIV